MLILLDQLWNWYWYHKSTFCNFEHLVDFINNGVLELLWVWLSLLWLIHLIYTFLYSHWMLMVLENILVTPFDWVTSIVRNVLLNVYNNPLKDVWNKCLTWYRGLGFTTFKRHVSSVQHQRWASAPHSPWDHFRSQAHRWTADRRVIWPSDLQFPVNTPCSPPLSFSLMPRALVPPVS